MINKDSKQELDEVVALAALQQTESQKQAQALAPGAVQQQDKPSFFNVSPFNDYRMEGLIFIFFAKLQKYSESLT